MPGEGYICLHSTLAPSSDGWLDGARTLELLKGADQVSNTVSSRRAFFCSKRKGKGLFLSTCKGKGLGRTGEVDKERSRI